jgi:hypothetical protein
MAFHYLRQDRGLDSSQNGESVSERVPALFCLVKFKCRAKTKLLNPFT